MRLSEYSGPIVVDGETYGTGNGPRFWRLMDFQGRLFIVTYHAWVGVNGKPFGISQEWEFVNGQWEDNGTVCPRISPTITTPEGEELTP